MMNVWDSLPRFRYFFYHPLKYLNDVRYAIKWSFQRVFRGYCDCDWFNFCDWFSEVVPHMIRNLIHGYGMPGDMGEEEWKKYLAEIAEHIEHSQEDQIVKVNLYDVTTEKDKYFARAKEISEWQQEEIKLGLTMIANRFYDLWD